ncbi:MAG: metallophosphoesterase, partial [Bacteroidota bacterium]|nr:metallophosphoesterase [Bacteroidota bacterium]
MKIRTFTLLILLFFMISMFNAYGQDEGFRKHPYILLKQNTVTIMWQLYDVQNCTFKYKKASHTSFTNVVVNTPYNEIAILYKYEITNLDYNTLYEFEVLLADGNQGSGSFLSPPLPSAQQISFYGYGDTRGGGAVNDHPPFHDEVCEQVIAEIDSCPESQTLIIHAADWNCYDTEMMWDSQYFYKEDANAINLRTKIGVVGCIGNHEADSLEAENYRKYWPYNYPVDEDYFWHSYDYGPVHFCFADQRWPDWHGSHIYDIQKNWIRNDLQSSNKPWKILVFHPPVYTMTVDLSYNFEKEFFDGICDSTETYGINMVINGHVHNYSNWLVNGVHHLTLGGGGATKDPNEPDLLVDDPTNPNIIKYSEAWPNRHYAKFDVNDEYTRVKVPLYISDNNWEIFDEFIIPHSFTIKSGESVVWEDHGVHYYADEIRVEDGGELTIKGDVEFQRDGRIIVEPGGRLTVDGALLTCLGEYNDIETHWQGIQVWGNKTENQFEYLGHPLAQGKLELINGAIIENAIISVDLWNPNHWGTTEGIVYADSAIFRNNAKSVHALYYKNFHPFDTLQEMDYQSNFKNCTFEITEDYTCDSTFYKHVDLAYVKGINFQACDFSVGENINGVSTWNHAIAGYDAKFRVSAICTADPAPAQGTPCPEIDLQKCTFTGFYSAISAVNDGAIPLTFSVNRANFINNSYGVKTRNMNNASVLFSDFEIGHLWDCGAGIFSDNVTGFAFEENNFSKF